MISAPGWQRDTGSLPTLEVSPDGVPYMSGLGPGGGFFQGAFMHPDRQDLNQFSPMRPRMMPPQVEPQMDFFPSLTDLDRMNEAQLEMPLKGMELPQKVDSEGTSPNVLRLFPDQQDPQLMKLSEQDLKAQKRKREGQEYTWQEIEEEKEKHKSAEKKRRGEMNDLLQRLKALLPLKPTTRMTKKNILFQSIQYISKLKQTVNQLQKENTDLRNEVKGKDEESQKQRG